MGFVCKFCGSNLSTQSNLRNHVKTNTACLKIQGKSPTTRHDCDYCDYSSSIKHDCVRHMETCKHKEKKLANVLEENKALKKDIKIKEQEHVAEMKKQEQDYKSETKKRETELINKTTAIVIDTIMVNPKISKSTSSNEDNRNNEEPVKDVILRQKVQELLSSGKDEEENTVSVSGSYDPSITTNNFILTLQGKEYIIPIRPSDGYINLTELAKALEYRTNNYFDSEKTQAYLKALSLLTENQSIKLVDSTKGRYGCTFVHPILAVHFAQWCSPSIGIQVSQWLEEIKIKAIKEQLEEKYKDALIITNKSKNEEVSKSETSTSIVPLISSNKFIITLQGIEYIIPIRSSDGYIDLTELAKALKYRTDHYFESENTRTYLKALSSLTEFRGVKLYDIVRTGKTQHTFIHRKIAYNYLQYVKPEFAAYVSTVLDNLFITGKVELGKEKNSTELEVLYKENLLLSQDLTKAQGRITEQNEELEQIKKIRPLLRRARPVFPSGNFIYLFVNRLYIHEKTFKIGQTNNLQKLYSGYNRSARTVIAYYRDCGSRKNSNNIESTIFNRLDTFRCQQNHELFNRKDKDLSFFIDEIDNTINYNLNTNGKGFINTNIIEELEDQDDFNPENEEEHIQAMNKKFIAEIDNEVQELTLENKELTNQVSILGAENNELKIRVSGLEEEISILKAQVSGFVSIKEMTELKTKNKILEERQASSENKQQIVNNNTTNINITIPVKEAKALLDKIGKLKDAELKKTLDDLNLSTSGLKEVKKNRLYDFLTKIVNIDTEK